MESFSLEGFIIQAFARGMANGSMANGTTNAVIEVTSENTALPETQVVPKRKRYSVPKNDECIRLVGEHTENLAKDADDTCMLCCENKVEVELIHSVCKGGDGKAHKCLNNRFCKSCITQTIAAQETRQSVVIPQCPCCRGRVSKMVQLDDNVVLDLPPFKPESSNSILANARRNKLLVAYNGTGILQGDTGDVNVSEWKILAPYHVEGDKSKVETYTRVKRDWYEIWNVTAFAMMNPSVTGWPDQKMLLRSINIKLKEINRSDFRWLPKVYGGTLHTQTEVGRELKRKRVTVSVTTSDGSGAGSSSSSSRTSRVHCDCSTCVRRRAEKAKKKRKKKRKKTSKKTE